MKYTAYTILPDNSIGILFEHEGTEKSAHAHAKELGVDFCVISKGSPSVKLIAWALKRLGNHYIEQEAAA